MLNCKFRFYTTMTLHSCNGFYKVQTRDAGSVAAPIRSFSADRVSVRRDRSKSDVVPILFCVVVKPHEKHKHHKAP